MRDKLRSIARVGVSVLLGAAVLAGTAVYRAGLVRVYVEEKRAGGNRTRVLVPGALISWGVKLIPEEKLRQGSVQARPWLPAIRAASAELERCPDGPLVEVQNPQERVSIVKRNGALVIDVDSTDQTVHVSIPLRTLTAVAHELEASHPGP